jgi:hypothetical protein
LPTSGRETAPCFVAALANIPDIRCVLLRAGRRFRRLFAPGIAWRARLRQAISGTGH